MRILFLDIDTLRPDHLGCYGYHRNTSPNIDRIAAQGTWFDNYYCSDAPCLPSRAALATGRFGIHTGVINHGGTNADLRSEGPARGFQDRLQQGYGLWSMFRNAGLWTASISPFAARHGAWWFNAGFREFLDPGKGGHESAEDVTPFALDWIRRNAARDDWLLHVNYWDPHTPYRAPAEFGNPFKDDPHERVNLAAQRPDICRRAAELYGQWHERMMATMENGAEDPLATVLREGGPFHSRGHLAQYCERLQATGRGWAVPELRRRHPGEFRK